MAAALDKASILSGMKGPLSFILTTTETPLSNLDTFTSGPMGRVLWAAVNLPGSYNSLEEVTLLASDYL